MEHAKDQRGDEMTETDGASALLVEVLLDEIYANFFGGSAKSNRHP